jgi:Ca2+-binding RTX toxin-like protein
LRAGFGNDVLSGGRGADIFGFYAAGDFVVQDFDIREDHLFFDSSKTGIDDLGELAQLVTSVEQTDAAAIVHFGPEASITLVGINLGDLSADMIVFGL